VSKWPKIDWLIDWLIECWLCIAQVVGQGSHTCCKVAHCCNIRLQKRQGFLNRDFGHKEARTRPSRHETVDETWDLRFPRWWTCKLAVVYYMTTCSFVGGYRFFGGETTACIFREDERTSEFLRQSGNRIWTHAEPHYEYITNSAVRCLVLNWTHR
jgi:hypothetical protein